MRTSKWTIAAPLLLVMGSFAAASEIRDDAAMFKPEAVTKAESILAQSERQTKIPVTIETISSLRGQAPKTVAIRRAEQTGHRGVFVMLAKQEKKVEVLVSGEWRNTLPEDRRSAIHDAFTRGLTDKGLDAGLVSSASAIGEILKDALATNGGPVARAPHVTQPAGRPVPVGRPARAGGGFIGGLFALGLIILVVLLVVRLLSGLARGMTGGGYGGQVPMGGAPGYGPQPGYGPGYAPRGGGGFWSSVFGGIGGAMAGNWIYDQMSGRNRHYDSGSNAAGGLGEGGYYGGDGGEPASGGGDWVGGGETTSWGDGGGGGGGDWTGGGGGGGDWGGGGGGGDGGGWS